MTLITLNLSDELAAAARLGAAGRGMTLEEALTKAAEDLAVLGWAALMASPKPFAEESGASAGALSERRNGL